MGGVHAAAHAILTVMTLILTVDPSDMDCEHVSLVNQYPVAGCIESTNGSTIRSCCFSFSNMPYSLFFIALSRALAFSTSLHNVIIPRHSYRKCCY